MTGLLQTGTLRARIASDPPGMMEATARQDPWVVVHVGAPVEISCRREGRSHSGVTVHGDIDIVPPGVASRWELKQRDTALLMSVTSSFVERVIEERGRKAERVEFVNRFQVRDAQIEHVGWALWAEMEAGNPTGELFIDSLATALTLCLLERHSSAARGVPTQGRMAGRRLRLVVAYIEENLARELSLVEIAEAAGMGASNCKRAFRAALGIPLHQYVIQRRVDRAKELLKEGDLPIAQIAAEAGFAHQSHLARHLRRLTGVSPVRFRREFGA